MLAGSLCLLVLSAGCHTVSLDSDPPGATVIVDGEVWGITPCTHTWRFGEKADGFTAAMILPGYDFADCPLLPRSRAIRHEESLLTSAPAGAQVYVNGKLVGTGPLLRWLMFPTSIRAVWSPDALARGRTRSDAPPASPVRTGTGQANVSCDIRVIAVANGSGVASASGDAAPGRLAPLAKELAGKLKEGVADKGASVAVVTLRNRSGTPQGKVTSDELADKVQGALIDTGWFDVKERIDLRGVLSEADLDTAGIVKNENVRRQLAGVKYVVIGGVTVTEAEKKP
jgi:hypothetical protein